MLPGKSRGAAPTLVILVRHGTTATTGRELPGRAPGLDLSDDGRRQAEAAARRLLALTTSASSNGKKGPAPVIFASPLERAQQTAAPIAAALDCEIQTDEGLLDLDTGEWTGLELKVARKRREWSTIQRYPSGFRFPGGESFLDMQLRMVTTLDRLRAEHPGQTVVAVSHADPIRAALAHALGMHLDLFQRIVISPGSHSAVLYTEEGPNVVTINAANEPQATSTS